MSVRTPEHDRRYRSSACKNGDHEPACAGYYPPGLDTYRCVCNCHVERKTMRVIHASQYDLACVVVDDGDNLTAQQIIDACREAGAVRHVDGVEFCVQLRAEAGPELWTADALLTSRPRETAERSAGRNRDS